MKKRVFFGSYALLVAGMCLALLFSGIANADLSKDDQKCVDAINKGAAKVAKAQGGDNVACIKNGGKGKLVGQTIEECLTSDPKGKVAKAISKLQVEKCLGPPAFPGLLTVTDKQAIGDLMVGKELALIHALFGTDLDQSIVPCATDKDQCKCQQAVAKAAQKCQDTKLKEFRSCKKNALKGKDGPAVQNAAGLRVACMADPGTGGIPDGKGKIAGKCADFDIAKKCAGQDLDVMIPGCAPGADADCVDQKIECEVCRALRDLDGLLQNCDVFDNGVEDGSCDRLMIGEIGAHLSIEDGRAICVGGDNDGGDCSGDSLIAPVSCPGGHCIAQAAHSVILNGAGWEIPFLLDGATSVDCGAVDPNTGIAPCQCEIELLAGQDISPIGWICLDQEVGLCGPGQVDCDGGSPMDQDLRMHHAAGQIANAQDPIQFPTEFCDINDPVNPNAECEAMCDLYCDTLGPAYEIYESSCEGYCQSGPDGVWCQFHADCPDNDCAGGSLAAPHRGYCQCSCIAQGIGNPSRPGAIQCAVGLHTTIEYNRPCGDGDLMISITPVCLPVTTETATASFDYTLGDPNHFDGITLLGDPGGGCDALITSVTAGSSLVGHSSNFDSTLGDVITRNLNVYK